MQFAAVNGINLHYQVIGAPEGKSVIVFANSLGTDFRIWRDVIIRLAGEATIIAYDKRGHGLSGTGNETYSIRLHAADLAGLLDHLGVKNAVICGISVGGLIAQQLAADRSDLVRALILCDTGAKIGTADTWNQRIATLEKSGMGAIADIATGRWMTGGFIAEHPEILEGYRTMVARQDPAGYVGTVAAIRDCDLTASSATLTVPVSVIVGERDEVTPPALAMELAELLPDSRYTVIGDAAHLPCIEQPDTLAQTIKAFLAEVAT